MREWNLVGARAPALLVLLAACGVMGTTDGSGGASSSGTADGAVFLTIDEESIDNGNPPNSFSDVEVNDQIAEVGVRDELR